MTITETKRPTLEEGSLEKSSLEKGSLESKYDPTEEYT